MSKQLSFKVENHSFLLNEQQIQSIAELLELVDWPNYDTKNDSLDSLRIYLESTYVYFSKKEKNELAYTLGVMQNDYSRDWTFLINSTKIFLNSSYVYDESYLETHPNIEENCRRAYRKMSLKFHPNQKTTNPLAYENPFKILGSIRTVLSDPKSVGKLNGQNFNQTVTEYHTANLMRLALKRALCDQDPKMLNTIMRTAINNLNEEGDTTSLPIARKKLLELTQKQKTDSQDNKKEKPEEKINEKEKPEVEINKKEEATSQNTPDDNIKPQENTHKTKNEDNRAKQKEKEEFEKNSEEQKRKIQEKLNKAREAFAKRQQEEEQKKKGEPAIIFSEKDLAGIHEKLFNAINANNIETFKHILNTKKYVNINAENGSMQTLLHMASVNNNPDFVDVLLARGAKVNAVDGGKMTPLDYAALQGRANVIEVYKKYANTISNELWKQAETHAKTGQASGNFKEPQNNYKLALSLLSEQANKPSQKK